MRFDLGEIVTIVCVAAMTILAIIILKGESKTIAAAGIAGLVGFLTKSNNGGGNATGETIITYPPSGGGDTDSY